MIAVDKEFLLDKAVKARNIKARILPIFIGAALTLFPTLFPTEQPINMLISIVVMGLIFGTVFIWHFGLSPIIKWSKIMRDIHSGSVTIKEDYVADKHLIRGSNNNRAYITFANYTASTKKGFTLHVNEYPKVEVGDKYYLVFVGKNSKLLFAYPAKDYDIDNMIVGGD